VPAWACCKVADSGRIGRSAGRRRHSLYSHTKHSEGELCFFPLSLPLLPTVPRRSLTSHHASASPGHTVRCEAWAGREDPEGEARRELLALAPPPPSAAGPALLCLSPARPLRPPSASPTTQGSGRDIMARATYHVASRIGTSLSASPDSLSFFSPCRRRRISSLSPSPSRPPARPISRLAARPASTSSRLAPPQPRSWRVAAEPPSEAAASEPAAAAAAASAATPAPVEPVVAAPPDNKVEVARGERFRVYTAMVNEGMHNGLGQCACALSSLFSPCPGGQSAPRPRSIAHLPPSLPPSLPPTSQAGPPPGWRSCWTR
jgi:hypothetical protein